MLRWAILLVSHGAMLGIGFGLGIYFLPVLMAPEGPDRATLAASAEAALFSADFTRDLEGSDFLHWGEGTVSITPTQIAHDGSLSPGPDYRLYLVGEFVEDEEQFLSVKDSAVQIGHVDTFDGFILDIPDSVDVEAYTTVLVWCEAFNEFITSATYR